jgi:hypothetical protein
MPERLGRSTTVEFSFTVSPPRALRTFALQLPAGVGFARSSLGLEQCSPARIAADGPQGCPADSRVGFGSALAEVPVEADAQERAGVSALTGPPDGEEMTILFVLSGAWPVSRQFLLTSHLSLAAPGPFGATLLGESPPLTLWPEGPAIALRRFQSTIGPYHLTYRRRLGSRSIAFTPRGMTLPNSCPRGGFPIAASFTWWDNAGGTRALTRVPCPQAGAARVSASRPRAPSRAATSAQHKSPDGGITSSPSRCGSVRRQCPRR